MQDLPSGPGFFTIKSSCRSNLFAYSNTAARITIGTLVIPLSMAVKESGLHRGAAGAVIVTLSFGMSYLLFEIL